MTEKDNRAREKRIHKWQGIKFFDGSPLPHIDSLRSLVPAVTVEFLRETKHVWRPEETVEAAISFFGLDNQQTGLRAGLRVIGPPQSGKGTILFGLSEICDTLGIGYVFIDGHHQKVNGAVVAETIARAQKMKIPVFFDSTDYLFLKSRKAGRSISKETQRTRNKLIMAAINAATIPIAITDHGEEWANEFLDLSLREEYRQSLDQFPRYIIPLKLQSEASIRRFLLDHYLPNNVVNYLLNMHRDEFVQDVLSNFINQRYPNLYPNPALAVNNIFDAIWTYPVLKDLAKQYASKLTALVNDILANQETNEESARKAIEDLGWLLFRLDEKRRNLSIIRRKKLPHQI